MGRFLGAPSVALLAAVLVAFVTFGKNCGLTGSQIRKFSESSLAPVAGILLVIAAGGGFSMVLGDSGVGTAIGAIGKSLALSPLLLGWIIAGLLRIAVGSATVAITTAAGLMAPVVAGDLPEDVRHEFDYNAEAYAAATAALEKQLAAARAQHQAALIAVAKIVTVTESQIKTAASKLDQSAQRVAALSTPTPTPQPQWMRDKVALPASLLDAQQPYSARDYSTRGYESSSRYVPSSPAQRTQHVSGYYTKRGTYVHSYKRSPPRY